MSELEIKRLLETLTIDEKISLLSGANFWESVTLPYNNLAPIVMNDGPFGLRKPLENEGAGLKELVIPATCFPTTSALASTFDSKLLYKMGQTLAIECIDQGVDLLLGPGVNMKRSPLCGRNFEYFSEDPLVTSTLAGALIDGLQSKGVGATIKHYAANNQENDRFTMNAVVDKKALNELYLKPFHDVIKKHNPYAVMCSYNQLNGRHTSRNFDLLTKALRHEACFSGLVMSDWGAVINLYDSVKAGLNLEMPGGSENRRDIYKALTDKKISVKEIDTAITPLIKLMIHKRDNPRKPVKCDYDKNFLVAQEIAEKSAVLLKNESNLLPLNETMKIALIGNFAKKPRYQGSGSSRINPYKLVSLFDQFTSKEINFEYADGYLEHQVEVNEELIKEAQNIARGKEVVILCVGLPEKYEVEGYDRHTLDIPPSHAELITRIKEVNENVVVLLSVGSPVSMTWLDKAKSVLLTHLMGSSVGNALYNLLFGQVNPCGKLAETYPLSLDESIPGPSFLDQQENVLYTESIYAGYRYYDTFKKEVLFPFGYGLSYTTFTSTPLEMKPTKAGFSLRILVKNTGKYYGGEVVGVYVGKPQSLLYAPRKTLIAFAKVYLKPREEKVVTLEFSKDDLKVYEPVMQKWVLENTTYDVYFGINVNESVLTYTFDIDDGENLTYLLDYKKINAAYYDHSTYRITTDDFTKLFGETLPLYKAHRKRPFNNENSVSDITDYWLGRRLYNIMTDMAAKLAGDDEVMRKMAVESIKRMPFRTISALSSGAISFEQSEALVDIANGKILKGLTRFLKKNKVNVPPRTKV